MNFTFQRYRESCAASGKNSAPCNVEQDTKTGHRIDRHSQKGKCAVASRTQFTSVWGMAHPAQDSNEQLPQLGPLQPQEEFIQIDLPQAQGLCE